MTVSDQYFDPMTYDALLELAARIGGRYIAWAREAEGSESAMRWRNADMELRRQARAVDPHDPGAIEAKRAELRELWASMPIHAPESAV